MEGFQRSGGGGNEDACETFVLSFGVGFTILEGEDSGNGVAFGVEKIEGLVGDGCMAGLEEGGSD